MRRSIAWSVLAFLPVAALSHCWWLNRAVPRHLHWVRDFATRTEDAAVDVCCYDTAIYVVGRWNIYASDADFHTDGFVMQVTGDPGGSWFKDIRTPATDAARAAHADATGVYVVGETAGSLTGQDRRGRRDTDAFVARYAPDGRAMWLRQFGTEGDDRATGVTGDATGVYVVGTVFEPSGPPEAPSDLHGFMRKYDRNGGELWTQYVESHYVDETFGVAADDSGVYVAGSGSTPTYPNAAVRKYDSQGRELWRRTIAAGSGWASGGCVRSGAIYVVGWASCLGGGPISGPFLRKYDTQGNEAWTRCFGGGGRNYVHGVWANDRYVYVVGQTHCLLPSPYPRPAVSDAFLAKYTTHGGRLWLKRFGTVWEDEANGVAMGEHGLYVVGRTYNASGLDSWVGTDYGFAYVLPGEGQQ